MPSCLSAYSRLQANLSHPSSSPAQSTASWGTLGLCLSATRRSIQSYAIGAFGELGHFIQAIVAPATTAQRLSKLWPELTALTHDGQHVLFPLEADLIDAKISPETTPQESGETFMLLTSGLRRLLATASIDGLLAYIETEYHGGHGGQGAIVMQNGHEIMPPEWSETDTINSALKLLGVKSTLTQDEFLVVRLGLARNNDDLKDQLPRWQPTVTSPPPQAFGIG